MFYTIKSSSLGFVLVAKNAKGVCAIFLGDDTDVLLNALRKRFAQDDWIKSDLIEVKEILQLIENPAAKINFQWDLQGTSFQQRVWQALQQIPIGKTWSYKELANKIGMPQAVRAVANACGANPLAIVVPCHRVKRRDGTLSGYRWGLERKQQLLKREEYYHATT